MAATTKETKKPDEFPVTLEEFCSRLSAKDKRVEMIGGFYADEKRSGHIKAMEKEFAGRYQAFIKRPVK